MPFSSTDTADKAALLAELRARVRRLEGGGGSEGERVLPFEVPDLDRHLPGGGLALECLHEIAGAAAGDDGAAVGFAATVLGRLAAGGGRVLWLSRRRDLYPPGLASLGLAPESLILVAMTRDRDVLWAMEEALRCRRLAAVLGEVGDVNLVASRRLQLAAESAGVTGLLLRPPAPRPTASAAVTRWRLSPASSVGPAPALDPSRWHVELVRCRGGRPGRWLLEERAGGTLESALIDQGARPHVQTTTRLRPLALAS